MFDRYNYAARRVVTLAREACGELRQPEIEPGHLLLGLLRLGDDVVSRPLQEAGVTEAKVLGRLAQGTLEASAETTPFSVQAKRVLDLALHEALQYSYNYLGPEHIFLGLLRGQDATLGILHLVNYPETLDDARRRLLVFPKSVQMETDLSGSGGGLAGTRFTGDDVVRMLPQLLLAARMLLVLQLVKERPETAPAAVETVNRMCSPLRTSVSRASCTTQAPNLEALVGLLDRAGVLEEIDSDLPKAFKAFVGLCLADYRKYLLGD